MTELSYQDFPKRTFAVLGTVVLALIAIAVAVNKSAPSAPDLSRCARAAVRVMDARDYSVDMMELAGPRAVAACRGLTAGQYARALLATYQIEYGGRMARTPLSYDMPPPSYKSLSAAAASRSRR